ncbi:MAG: BON domain-containing protein [Pseudomonadales bacterium]|nr:BON domain-containing protein [Pseudomonadales bacterium]
MKSKLAISFLVMGTLLAPVVVYADSAVDNTHPMTFVKDSVITTKIKAKLAEAKMSSLAHIEVDTDRHGAVVLSGNVRSQEDADHAVLIARATEGVTSVRSKMRIKKDD